MWSGLNLLKHKQAQVPHTNGEKKLLGDFFISKVNHCNNDHFNTINDNVK